MCTNHVFRILNLFMFSLAQAFGINLHLLYYKGGGNEVVVGNGFRGGV